MPCPKMEDIPLLNLGLEINDEASKILTLGDGDCCYSAALASARPGLHVCATTYDNEQSIPAEFSAKLPDLRCELDFTEPLPNPGAWDRIVVNFPVPIGRRHVSKARQMIRMLAVRVASALASTGQFWLTLEKNATESHNDGLGWDVLDAMAEAGLVITMQRPAQVRNAYIPQGVRTGGVLHVFERPGCKQLATGRQTLVRDVNLMSKSTFESLKDEVQQTCAPLDATAELLNTLENSDGAWWTVRLEISTLHFALSRRKVQALCESIQSDLPAKLPTLDIPLSMRRPGWNAWFHKVEPSVEDFIALMVRPVDKPEKANLLWTNGPWAHPSAVVNHFADAILDKRGIAELLRGSSLIPRTFILPGDAEAWSHAQSPYWIAKPARSGRGFNVVVFPDDNRSEVEGVVSEYISAPFLVDGRKVDLRLYVLIRELAPLSAFLHPSGYVRFAAKSYTLDDLEPQRHLTNNAINRAACAAPPQLPGLQAGPGDNWPLEALWTRVDKSVVWPRIHLLVAGALAKVASKLHRREGTRPFAFLGFDVLLDSELRPWLCEINANPTLEAKRAIDRAVDGEVFRDLLDNLEGGQNGSWEIICPPVA